MGNPVDRRLYRNTSSRAALILRPVSATRGATWFMADVVLCKFCVDTAYASSGISFRGHGKSDCTHRISSFTLLYFFDQGQGQLVSIFCSWDPTYRAQMQTRNGSPCTRRTPQVSDIFAQADTDTDRGELATLFDLQRPNRDLTKMEQRHFISEELC